MESSLKPQIDGVFKSSTKLTLLKDKCLTRIPFNLLSFYNIKSKSSLDIMKDNQKDNFIMELELPLSIDKMKEVTRKVEKGNRVMPTLVMFKKGTVNGSKNGN